MSVIFRAPRNTVRLRLIATSVALIALLAVSSAPAETVTIPETITPEMQAAFQDAKAQCEADASKYCRWVLPGGGRIAKCMVEHFVELSMPCQSKLAELMPQ